MDGNTSRIAFPSSHQTSFALELGTGTGNWAIELARTHPWAYICGPDISPIQPTTRPPKLHFYVHHCEEKDRRRRHYHHYHRA
jgi:hypothetical protein